MECTRYAVPCCGKNYQFAETNGQCLFVTGLSYKNPAPKATGNHIPVAEKEAGRRCVSASKLAQREIRVSAPAGKAREAIVAQKSAGGK